MIQYEVNMTDTGINILYYGKLFQENSNSLNMVYDFGKNSSDIVGTKRMVRTDRGFIAAIKKENVEKINFCFFNENNVWDNNDGNNYVYYVKNLEENNGTLLISEVQGKVFLPYTIKEVDEILNNKKSKYSSRQEVIEKVFTRPFNDYRHQFSSRFKESVELITKREKMSILDGINLGTELFHKRYLYPAIISACKNLDELNVYIDCLDKNELDDFKIFNIEYELYPMTIKNNNSLYTKSNIIQKTLNFIKKIFSKKNDYTQTIDYK